MLIFNKSRSNRSWLFILSRKVRRMRIEERIPAEIKKRLGYNNDSRRKKKKRCKYKHHEQLSEREVKYLMGQYMPTYKRGRGGAIRQR